MAAATRFEAVNGSETFAFLLTPKQNNGMQDLQFY